jgi:ABC-type multidrug transport system fused ATPase/permease subunit
VVVDDGRVAEVGTHAELVQRGGLYAKLVGAQSLTLSDNELTLSDSD